MTKKQPLTHVVSSPVTALLLSASVASMAGCGKKKEKKQAAPATQPAPARPKEPPKPADPRAPEIRKLSEKFKPAKAVIISEDHRFSDELVDLGRHLYYDTRLSKNHDISCNTCHLLDNFGVDGKPVSEGHKGQKGTRSAPSVYFAAGHIAQFWDGRAADVEEQAKGPILNPIEMAMPGEEAVVTVIKSIPGYAEPFKKAFPDDADPITFDHIADAIGAFERKLVAKSPWDEVLKGDTSLMTDEQFAGLKKFVEVGCPTCHEGPYVGGTQFKKMGAIVPFPELTDKGRFEVTKKPEDTYFFKVASLRDIEKTGPYFHDGSVASLEEAVKLMAKHQLGADISDNDAKSIVAFLGILTGEPRADYIAEPEAYESGPDTPKPDPS
jgi:cytochrome c peroxidase